MITASGESRKKLGKEQAGTSRAVGQGKQKPEEATRRSNR